jgi:AcrR family transcriptional regulator
MNVKQKIILGALELFMRYGIKSNTMDDIANHLSISKKTLYENFADKDELVVECITFRITVVQEQMLQLQKDTVDAIDELIKASAQMSNELKGMNPSVIMDMRKYYPMAWEVFHKHQKGFFMNLIKNNLERGVAQGLYRSGMDLQIVALKRMYEVEMCLSPDLFALNNFDMNKVQTEIMDLFMHGISTLKGHKLINKYKKIIED